MTTEQKRRTVEALAETHRMLEKFEGQYARRPEHLRTDEDRRMISFYRGHTVKLTNMLGEAK